MINTSERLKARNIFVGILVFLKTIKISCSVKLDMNNVLKPRGLIYDVLVRYRFKIRVFTHVVFDIINIYHQVMSFSALFLEDCL